MPISTLTPYEQEKLYKAVLACERGYWKSCADSILAVFTDYVVYPIEAIRAGKSLEDFIYMEQGVHFKATYKKMKQEYLQLKRRKLISVFRKRHSVIVKLTDKGFLRLAKNMLRRKSDVLPGGQLVFVAFDVPESANRARAVLRRFLKSSGFKMIQKSIWAIEFDVREAIMMIIGQLKISHWVSVILGSIQPSIPVKH